MIKIVSLMLLASFAGCAFAQSNDEAADESTLGGISIEERASLSDPTSQIILLHQDARVDQTHGAGYTRVFDRVSAFRYGINDSWYWQGGIQLSIDDRITAGHKFLGVDNAMVGGGLLKWIDPAHRYRFRAGSLVNASLDERFTRGRMEARLTRYGAGAGQVSSDFFDRQSVAVIYKLNQGTGFSIVGWLLELRDENSLRVGKSRLRVGRVPARTFPERRLYSRNSLVYSLSGEKSTSVTSTLGFSYQPDLMDRVNAEIFGGLASSDQKPARGFRLYLSRFF